MNLFSYVFLLIASPSVGWERINKLSIPPKLLQNKVFIPTLAVLSLSALFQLLYCADLTIVKVIVGAIINFVAFFSTFHISSIAMNFYSPGEDEEAKNRMDNMLIFSLEYLAILNIINNLLPSGFTILTFLNFYVIFLIIKGLGYINYKETPYVFVGITSALLLLLPPIIRFILGAIIQI